MSDTLIKVEGVSKKFCRNLKRSLLYGLKDLGNELRGRSHGGNGELRKEEFWAVKDANFELKRGECLGLIGHNGAGKTTLLRMLNGLIKPDQGRIEMRGRIAALIALGAGFNPILSGRENVYVSASVLGLTKREIDAQFDEIIDFAEIEEFIDMPVQSYSSGMTVRLGFSVATALRPDILLLDEVLAVGDVRFQVKCGNRIRHMATESAVIFVSHSMQYISAFCTRAMLMGHGQVVIDSLQPAEAIQGYYSLLSASEKKSGTGEACVEAVGLNLSQGGVNGDVPVIDQGEQVELDLTLTIPPTVRGATLTIAVLDPALTGIISFPVLGANSENAVFGSGTHQLRIPLGPIELNAGSYSLLVSVKDKDSQVMLLRHQGLAPFQVQAHDMNSVAKIIRPVTAHHSTVK